MKIKKEVPTSSTSENGRSSRLTTSHSSNIPQSDEDVKSNTLPIKYSMQEDINDTKRSNVLINSKGQKIDISNLQETPYMK